MQRFCFAIIFLLFLSSLLRAQHRDYHIEHYTTDQGLPQNSITGIVFDKAGYCWLGTEMGLVRFDGKKFTVFNAGTLPGVYSPRIRFCETDNDGNVYMNAEKGELIRIETNEEQAPAPHVEKGNNLWFWNTYSHVPMFVLAGKNKKNLSLPPTSSSFLLSYLLPSGDIYCLDGKDLYFLDNDRLIKADTGVNGATEIHLVVGDCFAVLDRKRPFVKWWKNGRRQKDMVMPGPLQQNKAFREGQFECLNNSGQSYVYAGGNLYGVYESNGELSTKLLLENLDIPVISKVYYHPGQQKYYIGSLVSGLYVVSPSPFRFLGDKPEIIGESVYAQAMNSKGDIICHRFLYERSGAVRQLPLGRYTGASLWLDKNEDLYYGDDPVLFRYSFADNSNRRITDLDSRPSSIFQDRFDSSNLVVVTTFSIDKISGDTIRETKQVPGKSTIMYAVQTGKDSFILATQTGVKWYDFTNNKIYRSVLDSVYVRNVYPEPGGRVWIATYGRGFYLYENGKVYSYPAHSTRALLTVHCFIDDGKGNFWLPTNNGLFVVKKASLLAYAQGTVKDIYFYMYSKQDNLLTNEFNGGCTPAYLWTKDSLLSLPSINGLVQFDPRSLSPMFPDKKIYAEEYRLNDKPFQPGNNLSLDPDYGNLMITVSSPYFGNRENLQMVYILKGLDENWQPVPASGQITLNHIPPGGYELLVRKLSGKGISEYDSFVFSFSVNPWFYNTWWFYSLLFVFVGLCVFIAIKLRTRILQERNRNLQSIIYAQTVDLSRAVEQLKESEQALKESNLMKDRVTTMVLHDLRSPIRFLHTISNQLLKKHQDLTPDEMKKNLGILQSSTGSLNDFTEQFFTWAASQHQDFKIQEESFLLQSLFNELEELYADIARANNNRLVVEQTTLQAYTDKNILSVIIRNLLDNASKNTMNGWINLSAKMENEKLVISVSDTGSGLSDRAIEEFYDGTKTTSNKKNGSSIVISLLEKIGGQLKVQSSINKGTSFNVELKHHQ